MFIYSFLIHHTVFKIGHFLDPVLDRIFTCFKGFPISNINFDTALKENCQMFTGIFSIISMSDGAFHRLIQEQLTRIISCFLFFCSLKYSIQYLSFLDILVC